MTMSVLLLGATGETGGDVLEGLLEDGTLVSRFSSFSSHSIGTFDGFGFFYPLFYFHDFFVQF